MKLISLGAVTALLGACSSAPPDTVVFDSGSFNYTVTQDGTNYTLLSSAPRVIESVGGVSFYNWGPSGTLTSGFAMANGTNGADYAVAAGLDNGTYFAGVSGALYGGLPVASTASLTGAYAFVVNGVDQTGPLAITADFGASTVFDTSPGIALSASISGSAISGTVTVGGETGNLSGGFYPSGVGGYRLVGAGVGANMAGILRVQ